jgi:hypothetical protein
MTESDQTNIGRSLPEVCVRIRVDGDHDALRPALTRAPMLPRHSSRSNIEHCRGFVCRSSNATPLRATGTRPDAPVLDRARDRRRAGREEARADLARLHASRSGSAGSFVEAHTLDEKTAKRIPKRMIGRRLTRIPDH